LSRPDGGRRPLLFSPLRIGPVTAPNRIVWGAHFTQFVEPARTVGEPGYYGARYGRYLGERAAGGAGVVIAGQAQVHPTTAYQMRNNAIAWDEAAVPHFKDVTAPVHEHGALAFLQLAHNGGVNDGTWSKLPAWAPSSVANYNEPPKPLERDEIREVVDSFARSAANAAAGGFDGIEVHGAHGYLIHEFLSPKSNRRTDEYGGSLENRMRFPLEVAKAVREAWPAAKPLFLRCSSIDDVEGGWSIEDSVAFASQLKKAGVDVIDCSSGGILGSATAATKTLLPRVPGFQLPFSEKIRKEAGLKTMAVGLILTAQQAEEALQAGRADLIAIGREALYDPNWPLHAARELGVDPEYAQWPQQYGWWLTRRESVLRKAGIRR
jgi:2,4-dienoyl-CoA reductase-like NADH-dependent reductase (Old Yellow Enzyme family)